MILEALIILLGIPYGIFLHKCTETGVHARLYTHMFPQIMAFASWEMWGHYWVGSNLRIFSFMVLVSLVTRWICEYKKVKKCKWMPKEHNFPN